MAYETQKQKYREAQRQLTRAIEERVSTKRAMESLQQTYSARNNQVSQCRNDKINLEKRLQQVVRILFLLGGSVPDAIVSVNSAANTAGKSFRSAMRCSEIVSASLETVFYTKSVEKDSHTASALSGCQAEKDRIEIEIVRLAASIKNLEEEMRGLWGSISIQNNRIDALNRAINVYQHDINTYRRYNFM